MNRFLYEKSVTYQECLIIPFVSGCIDGDDIYSYSLLSEQGYTSQLHQAKNPAQSYSSKLSKIIAIAKHHLDNQFTLEGSDYFRQRYTYRDNLIILHQEGGKCFYDHYAPRKLVNIAAPKVLNDVDECINWVRAGLQRNQI
ncbi:MAG: hypothetical protein ACFCAD_20800 [Pleurocapsa sp.]